MRKAWRDGDWDIAAGQFFTSWSEARHVIDSIAIEEDWPIWLSFDYGYNHWTACYLMTQTNDGILIVLDEVAARKQQPETIATQLDAMLLRNGIAKSRIRDMVAGHDIFSKDQHGKTIADDYKALGYTFEHAAISRINGAAELMKRLGDPEYAIEPTIAIVRRCTKLIECLPDLLHDPDNPEDVLKVDCDPDTGEGGDDAYDAARYGIMVKHEVRVAQKSTINVWKRAA
jgi:phage terminase large subunit